MASRIHAAGGELVTIGSGSPSAASAFAEELHLETPLVSDPSLAVFSRAGMKRGALRTLNPLSMARSVGVMAKGFRQTATRGDPWQQGGVVVVGARKLGGKLMLQKASSTAGEPTDFELVVRAVADAKA